MKKLIQKLTPEQEAGLPEWRDKWLKIGLSCEPCDLPRARVALAKVYGAAKLPPPKWVLVADSPLGGAIMAVLVQNLAQVRAQVGGHLEQVWGQVWGQVSEQVWEQVERQVRDQVLGQVRSQVWDQVGGHLEQVRGQVRDQVRDQVRGQVWEQVRDQVLGQVEDQVRSQVWAQVGGHLEQVRGQVWEQVWGQVWEQVSEQVERRVWDRAGGQVRDLVKGQVWDQVIAQVWGSHESGWLSFYDYFYRVAGLEVVERLSGLIELAQCCGWWAPYRNMAILQHRHCELHLNAAHQIHNERGAAVLYRDGLAVWALNGVRVPRWLVETPAEQIDPLAFSKEENAQIRREIVRKVGVERLCAKLGSKILDQRGDYELHLINLGGATGSWPYLKMKNPSIGVYHMEAVAKECSTVEQALAFRNGGDLIHIVPLT